MKKLFTFLAVVVTMTAMSQSVAISDNGSVADGSAILEVKSTTKGFLPPRMSKVQRDAMTSLAPGLQIWCTDCVPTAAMYFYNGSEWSTGGTGITSEQATAITDNTKKVGITTEQADIIDNTSGSNTGDQTLSGLGGVESNDGITAGTNTKISYDEKGLVIEAADATTADIAATENKNYVTNAQLTVLDNTSSTNTGDNATNTQYSDQAALITILQAQTADLQAQIDAMGSGTAGVNLPSVNIGDQTWQLRNLDLVTYRDGTTIPQAANPAEWNALTTGAWCYYDNDADNGTTRGKLYNWYALMGITDAEDETPTEAQIAARKQLAPTGWHIPSDAEWTTLTIFLGDDAGAKMKEKGTEHWDERNVNVTNTSGFTALPGGHRFDNGFQNFRYIALWWSSTQNGITHAVARYLRGDGSDVYSDGPYKKTSGFSVRCLRD